MHRLLTILSAVSLLLCVAAVVFWVRSYWVFSHADDHAYWIAEGEGRRAEYWAGSCSGRLFYARSYTWTDDSEAIPFYQSERHGQRFEAKAGRSVLDSWLRGLGIRTVGGFGYNRYKRVAGPPFPATTTGWAVAVPCWAVAALFALAPAAWLRRERQARLREHRLRAGACLTCGYDLRASRERCPECGKAAIYAEVSP